MLLAWLYWNPPRELFRIPYLDHPIAIYGVCFVTGLVLAFLMVTWMLTKKILILKKIRERDIADWPALVKLLVSALEHPPHPLHSIITKLDRKIRQEITQLQLRQEPHDYQKKAILCALNNCQFSRAQLEEQIPKAFKTAHEHSLLLTDRLTWYVVLGTIIGARLGHVFFYEWPRYQNQWIDIFKVWEGGLASHGGGLGVLIAVYIYYRLVLKKFGDISFISLVDCMAIPTALVFACIRIGNFFNQEILGPATTLPWGVIFGDPIDGIANEPRHPTQLYEAGAYLAVFALLFYLWNKRAQTLRPGFLAGLFIVLVCIARFLIEFIKLPQSMVIDESFLQMGQILTIPFIFLGLAFLIWGPKWDARSNVVA